MIESDPIPAGENNYIKICLIEDDYRLRITDLYSNILFELVGDEIFKFNIEYNQKLLTIQELMAIENQKQAVLQSARFKTLNNEHSQVNTVRTSSLNQGPNEKKPAEKHLSNLELIPINPVLSSEDIQKCIIALKRNFKLSEKVIIDNDENLEEVVLQVFDGERTTVSKIINHCGRSNISILSASLGRTLERLVQEGKITSTKEKIKNKNLEYNLYAINYNHGAKKSTIDLLLTKLEKEFTTESFIDLAKQSNIQEESAIQMLEQSASRGELLEPRSGTYRKIE